MNLNDLSTQLLFTTAPIWVQKEDSKIVSGTCFFYNLPIPGKENQAIPLLITNHHVIEGGTRALAELVTGSPDEKPFPREKIKAELDINQLISYSNKELDIAAIPIGPILNASANQGKPIFFRGLEPQMVAKGEVLSNLASLEEIIFIGYPSGLRDDKNSTPLIRRGITATPAWNDFQGHPSFLIDAGVFPGSSGSPVLIFNQGSYTVKDGIAFGNRILLLGVITQTMQRIEDESNVYLGLGKVVRAEKIHAYLEKTMQHLFNQI